MTWFQASQRVFKCQLTCNVFCFSSLALKEQNPYARILNRLGLSFKRNSLAYWASNIVLLNLILASPWLIFGLILKEFEQDVRGRRVMGIKQT